MYISGNSFISKNKNHYYCNFLCLNFPSPKCAQCAFLGIPEKQDLGPGTRDPGSICGTRDPGTSTWDPGRRTHKRDPGPEPLLGIQDLGPSTQDPLSVTWDFIYGKLDPIPLRGTRDPSRTISHTKMDYLNLEKSQEKKN